VLLYGCKEKAMKNESQRRKAQKAAWNRTYKAASKRLAKGERSRTSLELARLMDRLDGGNRVETFHKGA